MSGTTDKIKGVANQAAGSVKETIGKAVGSDKMQVEGAAQNLKGHAQEALGDAKNAVQKQIDEAKKS